jgi:hypothetical protein
MTDFLGALNVVGKVQEGVDTGLNKVLDGKEGLQETIQGIFQKKKEKPEDKDRPKTEEELKIEEEERKKVELEEEKKKVPIKVRGVGFEYQEFETNDEEVEEEKEEEKKEGIFNKIGEFFKKKEKEPEIPLSQRISRKQTLENKSIMIGLQEFEQGRKEETNIDEEIFSDKQSELDEEEEKEEVVEQAQKSEVKQNEIQRHSKNFEDSNASHILETMGLSKDSTLRDQSIEQFIVGSKHSETANEPVVCYCVLTSQYEQQSFKRHHIYFYETYKEEAILHFELPKGVYYYKMFIDPLCNHILVSMENGLELHYIQLSKYKAQKKASIPEKVKVIDILVDSVGWNRDDYLSDSTINVLTSTETFLLGNNEIK